jgi:hypothetical protein
MRKEISIAVFLLVFVWGARAQTPTLGEVLSSHHIPTDGLSAKELEQPITSWEISEKEPFVLAYFDDDGSGLLHEPLHVLRYASHQSRLQRLDIRGEINEIDLGGASKPSSNCMGSVLRILQTDKKIFIETHINPSAACTLVLDTNLKLNGNFFGWILGITGPYAIVERNQIHFAAVHPAELAILDSEHLRWSEIYPIRKDPARDAFSKELEAHAPDRKWCRENNNPCDPLNFDVDIQNLDISADAKSFTFEAVFSPDAFGEEAEKTVRSVTAQYVCQLQAEQWSCQLIER